MHKNPQHEKLVKDLTHELKAVLEKSDQAIYLYLDDTHKTCNLKFAKLLGYKNISEWVVNQYPVSDVDRTDEQKVIHAYTAASEKFHCSTIPVRWKTKNGKKLDTSVTFVPLSYQGEVFVLHFISPQASI